MRRNGRMNDASRYRSIARRVRDGADPKSLTDDLERIKDPYYSSLALQSMSGSFRAERGMRRELLSRAVSLISDVPQEWRRAELMEVLLKRSRGLPPELESMIFKGVLRAILDMEDGSGVSQSIRGCSGYLLPEDRPILLERALNNRGFEKDDSKAVIRSMVQGGMGRKEMSALMSRLNSIEDVRLRISLLGYLHLQLRKKKGDRASIPILGKTLKELKGLRGDDRSVMFSYLCRNCISRKDLPVLEKGLELFEEPVERIRALGDLATASDRARDRDRARKHLETALSLAPEIETDAERAHALSSIASAEARLGNMDRARDLFQKALDAAQEEVKLSFRIEERMVKAGIAERKARKEKRVHVPRGRTEGHVLVLCDTYEGGMKPVHSRAAARAAPLCAAFSLELGLMGFPTSDLDRIVNLASSETNIGKGGEYLGTLRKRGKVHLIPYPENDPLSGVRELGLPVATTPSPDKEKLVSMREAVSISREKHPAGRICLIMGLGRRGLPDTVLEEAPYHLEITGEGTELETATAMGILAFMLKEASDAEG
ncbi:hypothetical protein B6U90_05450 [Thermoplasmatales archaeon ex4484_6]|nr:MAG: hypothetical protein B6U90_05450 [Thermoplasmatales archaeon ex4484_6]